MNSRLRATEDVSAGVLDAARGRGWGASTAVAWAGGASSFGAASLRSPPSTPRLRARRRTAARHTRSAVTGARRDAERRTFRTRAGHGEPRPQRGLVGWGVSALANGGAYLRPHSLHGTQGTPVRAKQDARKWRESIGIEPTHRPSRGDAPVLKTGGSTSSPTSPEDGAPERTGVVQTAQGRPPPPPVSGAPLAAPRVAGSRRRATGTSAAAACSRRPARPRVVRRGARVAP